MSEPYVCTLDPATQLKAQEQLNEDPKNRQGAIDTFREWILQQKHFTCPTDDIFLLAFLRAKKYSQLEARLLLERYLTSREKLSEWFKDIDTTSEQLKALLDDGCCLILPKKDKEGRTILINRPGLVNNSFKRYGKDDVFKMYVTMVHYLFLCNEDVQVHGSVSLVDLSHYSVRNQKISIEDRKKFLHAWQKSFPARMKEMHLYNGGSVMEFVMMMIKLTMSEKVQKRVVLHTRGLEMLYDHVSKELLPVEYLPDDYDGPNAGTIQSIIEVMKQTLEKPATRDRLRYLSSRQFVIDMKDKDRDVPQASFRKLNVD